MTTSSAGFNLAVAPTLGFSDNSNLAAGTAFAVPPSLAFGGSGVVPAGFNLAVAPTLGVSGASASTGAFSLAVPPSLGFTVPIAFDAVGAGYTGTTTGPSWSHTIGAAANAIVAFVQPFIANSSPTITAKVGTTSMSQLGVISNYESGSGFFTSVYVFGLLNPPTGAQTIAVTASNSASTSANSLSFTNVASFGTPTTASGASGNPSMTVSSASGQVIAQAFGGYTTNFTAYNQTQEYNAAFVSSHNLSAVMGYAAGASSVTFSATGSQPWGGIALPLNP